MPSLDPLDNPIWNALRTEHSALALAEGNARRYPPEIGPLSGIADQSPASYESLRALAGPDDAIGLFLTEPPVDRPGWTLIRGGELSQMICTKRLSAEAAAAPPNSFIRRLTAVDVPEMMELARQTEPGPFRARTIELGVFFGAFDSGRLVAMAGQRLHLPEFVEVSAVCTYPEARGHGLAPALMSKVILDIQGRGKVPVLHTFADNFAAIRVYEGLGFTLQRTLHLAVLKRNP